MNGSAARVRKPFVGPCPVLYHGEDVRIAWSHARRDLVALQPPSIEVHGWMHNRSEAVIAAIRRELPHTAIALGPGLDPVATNWRSHRDGDRAVAAVLNIARAADAAGLDALVVDPETSWKGRNPTEHAALSCIAVEVVETIARELPELPLYVTTFSSPVNVRGWGGHRAFPWGGWLRPSLSRYVSQVYFPGPMGLRALAALSRESFDEAVKLGVIPPGVERFIELQLHHNHAEAIVAVALDAVRSERDVVQLWAPGTSELCDAKGLEAMRVLVRAWHAGVWREGAVNALQELVGAKVDGDYGPVTHSAVLRWMRPVSV